MTDCYDIGDLVRLTGTFTDTGGTPTDPTFVQFQYQAPGSTSVDVTTPTTEISNPTVGTYTYDVLPNATGLWEYRISSTGNIITAEESYFVVQTPRVT